MNAVLTTGIARLTQIPATATPLRDHSDPFTIDPRGHDRHRLRSPQPLNLHHPAASHAVIRLKR